MAICSAALTTSFSVSSVSLPGSGSQQQLKAREIGFSGGKSLSQKYSRRNSSPKNFSVRSDYSDDNRGGGGADFLAGFLVGGAVFGTLTYVFAPQIRRSLLNEDEYGFRKARRPIYYDEGLEKTRQTLNAKISQLNSAIDNVSSRLRGGNNVSAAPIKSDPEVEATM